MKKTQLKFYSLLMFFLIFLTFIIFTSIGFSQNYITTDLGLGGRDHSWARDVNESGDVVGWVQTTPNYGFLYTEGSMINLSIFNDGRRTSAFGVNNTKNVVGQAQSATGEDYAFLYNGIEMKDIGTLGGDYGWAIDINNKGSIVGQARTASGEDHAFFYDGIMTDLDTLGGDWSRAEGINDFDEIAGSARTSDGKVHAFLFSDGIMSDLGTFDGGDHSSGVAINNLGEVVGQAKTASGEDHAFLYSNSKMIDLGTLGGMHSMAYGINDESQIVGWSWNAYGYAYAFFYKNGTMYNLNDFLPSNSEWTSLQSAHAINNKGQIVGIGYLSGRTHAFLMTPSAFSPLELFGWKYPGGLISIDSNTGVWKIIIPSDRQIEALAFDDKNDVLYGIENLSNDNMLLRIDLKAFEINELGLLKGFKEITSMTFPCSCIKKARKMK